MSAENQTPPTGDAAQTQKTAPELHVQMQGAPRPQDPTQAEVTWPLEADRLSIKEPLLECLQIAAGLFGRRVSVNALAAGLPIARTGLSPSLFIRAAERADLTAKLVERPLVALAIAPNLPCVLALNGKGAALLKGVRAPSAAKGKTKDERAESAIFDLVFPETPEEVTPLTFDQLSKIYEGHSFFIRPTARLDERAGPAEIEEGRDWFWSALKANKSIYIEVFLAAVVINIFATVAPLFTMNVYDRVVPNNALSTMWVLVAGISAAYVFDLVLKILRSHFLEVAGRRADVVITSRIFEQVMGMKMSERPGSAGVMVANMREFDSLRDFFTSATMVALIDLPFALLFIAIIAALGGPVVFAVLAAIPVVVAISIYKQRHLQAIIRQSMAENALKNAILYENVTGLETVKVQAAEGHLQRQWEQLSERASKTALATREISSSIQYWAGFVIAMSGVGIMILGVMEIADAKMTTGALIASYMLSTRALSPLGQIAGLLTRFQQTKESLAQLNNLMKKKVERPKGKHFIPMPSVKGRLDFRGVSFAYPNTTIPALKNISFTIAPGEHVGIIGAVGSGKTTMQRLMLNLYEPSDGAVLLDGTDVRQIDPGDLRRAIGVVQQRPQLFYGSIRQNITMGHETVSDAAILRAAELAGVMDFLRDTQAGLDTPVGERGEALSGGQQQAVAIARALLYDPPVLILDEPTASLDPATENRLLKRLHILTKDRTVLLITHKGPMLALIDRIILMDKAHILGDGPRDAIITRLQNGEFQARKG